MSEKWTIVKLGEVLAASNVKLGVHEAEPRVFSISKHKGVLPADSYHDRRMASQNLKGYKWLRDGWWLYSTIHIDEGSIARNTTGMDGVVSPMYTVMTWKGDQHDPRYFEVLLRSPMMLARYSDNAKGSVNRRKSLSFTAFAQMEVKVPSLKAQKRIVDLVDAVGAAERAAFNAAEGLKVLRTAVGSSLMSGEHEIPESYDELLAEGIV